MTQSGAVFKMNKWWRKTRARLYSYVEVKLIDVKTKYYKDRRGLEQEEVEALLFEWTPWDIASIALVF